MAYESKEGDGTMPPPDEELNSYEYSYGGGKKESYRDIVMRQIERCRTELSKNLTEGGVFMMMQKNGVSFPKIIEDQWEVNERCVNTLSDLMNFKFTDDDVKPETKGGPMPDNILIIIDRLKKEREKRLTELKERYLRMEVNHGKKDLVLKSEMLVTSTGSGMSAAEKYAASAMRAIKDDYTRGLYRELLMFFKRNNELSNIYYMDES